jgi:methyl-galactoside transport system ATP-binding protein
VPLMEKEKKRRGRNNMANAEFLLEMNGITKEFPGVKALDGVSLQVKPGSVHALMGENGAGKSTLMKCLFGIYSPDAGEIFLNGQKAIYQLTPMMHSSTEFQ